MLKALRYQTLGEHIVSHHFLQQKRTLEHMGMGQGPLQSRVWWQGGMSNG